MNELLLHTCCAPCASGCVERLFTENRKVILYFSNSNINTEAEFQKRLSAVRLFAKRFDLPVLVDPYCHTDWLDHIAKTDGFAQMPERGERCLACFSWSLARTAEKAKELGMNFATTLTVSPHKNSESIFALCSGYSHFEPYNFKKQNGFQRSLLWSRELELYRQNYCGCEFSIRKSMESV